MIKDELIQDIKVCPECHGNLIKTSYELVCRNCGLVLDKIYQESSYVFDNVSAKSNLSRQFVALGNRADFIGGLGTCIDFENSKYLKDKFGRLLPPNEQQLFRRLKKNYTKFIRIKNHETEYRIFNILNKIVIYLNLNKNTRSNAAYYYKKVIKNEGKVINNISLLAFCIFYAARKEYHNAPITINEIASAFQNFGHRVSPRLILRDGLRYKKYVAQKVTPHKSEDYLIRLTNEIINHRDLNGRLEKKGTKWSQNQYHINLMKKSRDVFHKLDTWQRGGRNPFILAGAVIYLADKLLAKEFHQRSILTQKLISEATNIAEYSIRDHYVNLLKPLFLKDL